jgi:hypothetical protein
MYFSRVLYRGIHQLFSLKIGQRLAFQHFISTSRNSNVAQGFSWGNGSTVFEIHAERSHPLRNGIYLGIHSMFSSEEEVLLSPLQVFEVESLTKDLDTGVLHVVLKTNSYLLQQQPEIPSGLPECEKCAPNPVEGGRDYLVKLKLAVAVLGSILATTILVGGMLSLYMVLIQGRKFCYKVRTSSEIQLT